MLGWIKFQRDITEHWCASDPIFFAVWFRLVAEANYKDQKTMLNGSPVTVKRGQLIFGLNAFSNRSGVSIAKLRRVIKILLYESMIDRQIFSKYSIISITNYEKYQVDDKQNARKTQAEDKQTTILKEEEVSKYKKDIPIGISKKSEKKVTKNGKAKKPKILVSKEFADDSTVPHEYREYAEKHGFDKEYIQAEFRIFFRYFDEKGTKRPGWYRSWQNWIDRSTQWKSDTGNDKNGTQRTASISPLNAAREIICGKVRL